MPCVERQRRVHQELQRQLRSTTVDFVFCSFFEFSFFFLLQRDDGKLQLAPETLQRVSQAQLMAKETFDKEQRRLEKEEQRKLVS